MYHQHWYQYPLKEITEVKIWVKQGNSTPKKAKEMDIYKYSSVIPAGLEKTLYWKRLVNDEVTTALRLSNTLDWCSISTRLHAVKSPNDQNSLYDSISVCLWGVPDDDKIVKHLLKDTIKQHGLFWNKRLGQNQTKVVKPTHENVMPHHVFILANRIQRPLIILSDKKMDAFNGIYLPLMSKPIDCTKAPIFLAHYGNRFYPLLIEAPIVEKTMSLQTRYKVLFPLVHNDQSSLPIKFLDPKQEIRAGEILQDYLIVKEMDLMVNHEMLSLLFLDSSLESLPENKNTMFHYGKTFAPHYSKGNANQRTGLSPSLHSSQERQNDNQDKTKKVEGNFMSHSFQYRPDSVAPQHLPLQQPSPVLPQGTGAEVSHGVDIDMNKNGYHGQSPHTQGYLGELPYAQINPSAPEVYEEPLSMTPDYCMLCKTYRSSIKTYPFCHECFKNQNGISQVPGTNGKSLNTTSPTIPSLAISNGIEPIYKAPASTLVPVNDRSGMPASQPSKKTTGSTILPNQTPLTNGNSMLPNRKNNSPQTVNRSMFTSVSDQSEMWESYSPKSTEVFSPSQNAGKTEPTNNSQNHPQEQLRGLRGNGELPAYYEESFIEVSYDPPSVELPLRQNKPTKCASPVCEALIRSPEQLCQKCIKILKIHHLSNCDKACCNSPISPRTLSHSPKNLEYQKPGPPDVPKSSSLANHPTLQDKRKDFFIDQYSVQPSDTPEDSEPESPSTFPWSLMVTSVTSVHDTEEIIEAIKEDSLNLRFSEIENHLKKDAVKCKTPQCTNFANKDREGLCNVCFSVKTIPPKHDLDSIPVCFGDDQNRDSYGQNMEQLENNMRKTVSKCKTSHCTHFGNKLKDDYCNVCYNAMQIRSGSLDGWYGNDVCDGETYPMDTDETSGSFASDLNSDLPSSQIDPGELYTLTN